MEQAFLHAFAGKDTMKHLITVLCKHNMAMPDPISHVVCIMLSSPLHIQLVANGLQMFRGKDVLFPYQSMSIEQREFLLKLMQEDNWGTYEYCLVWKGFSAGVFLDHMLVLQSVCELVHGSKKYSDDRSKLAISNIILQRVHSNVVISKSAQAALNKLLFCK